PAALHSFPTRRSSDLFEALALRFSGFFLLLKRASDGFCSGHLRFGLLCASLQARGRFLRLPAAGLERVRGGFEFLCVFAALCQRSEEHTSELQSRSEL